MKLSLRDGTEKAVPKKSSVFQGRRNLTVIYRTPGEIKPQLSAWLHSPGGNVSEKMCFSVPNPSKTNVMDILKTLSE